MLTFTDNFENDKELILRDHLALERTKLANERTLFAYIRMALYLLTVGIGIFQIESISMVLVATAYSSGKILPPISFAHALVNSAPVYMMMEE